MDEQTELLREIRDLLRLMAEPDIAKRDAELRAKLVEIVGKGASKTKAVLLMDGSRSQGSIAKEAEVDPGLLSRLLKSLREAKLLMPGDNPRLAIAIPPRFFETTGEKNGK